MISVFHEVVNIVRKGENADFKSVFLRVVKVGIVW